MTAKIKTKIEVEARLWVTPNFIRVSDDDEANVLGLREADAVLLGQLCDAFREEIFRKAGKKDPRLT